MQRYPFAASFLEGLRPFKLRKFEAIIVQPAEGSLSKPVKQNDRRSSCASLSSPACALAHSFGGPMNPDAKSAKE
ncbi:hypothetical protein H5410_015209 [Solanum commersonii]|uniref:Uncharacterized protein n=1 Tax=Solanum commersonii TaxID=4109 RepID=A0A9J5ZT63_SOLCO|nr:hypothetical protein H5410_015209 [Solanum commersonii]